MGDDACNTAIHTRIVAKSVDLCYNVIDHGMHGGFQWRLMLNSSARKASI